MSITTPLALSGAESPVSIPRSLESIPLCSTKVKLQVCLSHHGKYYPRWAFSGEETIEMLLALSHGQFGSSSS